MRTTALVPLAVLASAAVIAGTAGLWESVPVAAAAVSISDPVQTPGSHTQRDMQTGPAASGRTPQGSVQVSPFAIASQTSQGVAEDGVPASWTWSELGSNLGAFGFFQVPQQKTTEIVISSGSRGDSVSHWRVMRVAADGKSLKTSFRSPDYVSGIVSVFPITAKGMKKARIGVASFGGVLQEFTADTRSLLSSFTSPCSSRSGLAAATAADLYNDGSYEYLSLCYDQSLIVHDRKNVLWTIPNFNSNSYKILVGQVDSDPGLEIISQSGLIVDPVTKSQQGNTPTNYSWSTIDISDLNNDGKNEIVESGAIPNTGNFGITVWDVEKMSPSLIISGLTGSETSVVDVDGDRIKDIVSGGYLPRRYTVYDSKSGNYKGIIDSSGISPMLATDSNKDGRPELISLDNNTHQIFLSDWQSKSAIWQSEQISGPYFGPEVGDIDGDGKPEIVFASSNSGYLQSGKIIVIDAASMEIKAISDIAPRKNIYASITDIRLRDLDGDGLLDILIAFSANSDGGAEAYKISKSGTFSRFWYTRSFSAPFEKTGLGSIDVGDLDGDGVLEVIGGADSNGDSRAVWAFDISTGRVKFKTAEVIHTSVYGTVVADTNRDNVSEVFSDLNGTITAFSGAALDPLESLTETYISNMTVRDANIFTFSHADGTISQKVFEDFHWRHLWTRRLADLDTTISGATDFGATGLWAGMNGQVAQYDTMGNYVRRSAKYGEQIGKRFVLHPDGQRVLTCSSSGIFAFSR